MADSQILRELYATPDDDIFIPALAINLPNGQSIRLNTDKQDHILGGQLYESCPIDISLPQRAKGEKQMLRFTLGMLDHRYYPMIQDAVESGSPTYVIYSEWRFKYKSAPIKQYPPMPVYTGQDNPLTGAFQIDATYLDLLDTAYPRKRFTAQNTPGVRYL